jgi:hypothetical protein
VEGHVLGDELSLARGGRRPPVMLPSLPFGQTVRMRALLLTCLLVAVATAAGAAQPQIPATTRKVVLEKIDTTGHRWQLITDAPVPKPTEHQVLVHVRAVSLNRGDLEILDPDQRDLSGRIVASDAAGDVVAVGSQVKGVRVGASPARTSATGVTARRVARK